MSSIKPLTQHSIDHVWHIIKHCDSLGLGTEEQLKAYYMHFGQMCQREAI